MPVRDYRELGSLDIDAVVVATFDKPKNHLPALQALGLPAAKLLTLYPPSARTAAPSTVNHDTR